VKFGVCIIKQSLLYAYQFNGQSPTTFMYKGFQEVKS